jgi:O-antigen/teichoic acid export membrane protein
MAARVIDAAFALVYLRVLGLAGTGSYQQVVVLTTYLDTLIDFGLNALLARDVPRSPGAAGAAFRAVALVRLGLWLVGLPLVALIYGPGRDMAGVPADAALAGGLFYLGLLPTVLAKTATGLLWAFERLELPAGVSVVATVFKTGLGVLVLASGFGLVGLAASSLLVNLVTAGALLVLLARVFPRHRPPSPAPRSIGWVREAWPLFVNQLLQGLFFKVDAVLLPPLAGATAAGAYAAAYKVGEGAGIISSSFTLALFPRLSREADLARAYRLALRVLLQLAFPLATDIAILAEHVVAVVGGRAFLPDAAIALAILIWYLPLSFANGLTQYVLIAAGRQRFLTAAFLAAFIFNVAANLVLIPRFGFVGAALITVASELVLLIPFRWAAERAAPGASLVREARRPIVATLLMAPVVWWLRDALHPLVAVAAGSLVYPISLWAVGGIDADEWSAIRRLLAFGARRPRPATY